MLITLNYRDSAPIYEQVKNSLRRLILNGVLATGEKLPSVRTLAGELAINPNTIQRAYAELEQEGFIYSLPGKGSFVAEVPAADEEKKRELLDKLGELVQQLRMMGASEEELQAAVNGRKEKET